MKLIHLKPFYLVVGIAFATICIFTFSNFRNKEKPSIVQWITYEQAQKLTAKKPRKIFIDVYTDWCGWCKKMDANTLSNVQIGNYLNEKYYAVKLNAESDAKTVYKGKEMTERELASKIFKATGFPTTVYLDEKENLLQPISSYLEVDVLDKILHYYGENFYQKTDWATFESMYSKK
jgi:thioredoxin-related protein